MGPPIALKRGIQELPGVPGGHVHAAAALVHDDPQVETLWSHTTHEPAETRLGRPVARSPPPLLERGALIGLQQRAEDVAIHEHLLEHAILRLARGARLSFDDGDIAVLSQGDEIAGRLEIAGRHVFEDGAGLPSRDCSRQEIL